MRSVLGFGIAVLSRLAHNLGVWMRPDFRWGHIGPRLKSSQSKRVVSFQCARSRFGTRVRGRAYDGMIIAPLCVEAESRRAEPKKSQRACADRRKCPSEVHQADGSFTIASSSVPDAAASAQIAILQTDGRFQVLRRLVFEMRTGLLNNVFD